MSLHISSYELLKDKKDEIIDLYLNQKISQRKLSEMYGVSKSSMGVLIKDIWKVEPPIKEGSAYQIFKQHKNEIIAAYIKEGSSRKVSKEFGISKPSLIKFLKQEDVKITEYEDLTGKIFGYLQVLHNVHKDNARKGEKYWRCKCLLCNKGYKDVITANLKNGKIIHCGCATCSKGVLKIKDILTQNNIEFNTEHTFQDCRYPLSNQLVKYDFFVDNKYIIEFDGQQHFYYTGTGWDTQEHFERTRNNDLIKNKYCFDNNIPIIRIPYDADYDDRDLRLETTRFLFTPENEKEYYESRGLDFGTIY